MIPKSNAKSFLNTISFISAVSNLYQNAICDCKGLRC